MHIRRSIPALLVFAGAALLAPIPALAGFGLNTSILGDCPIANLSCSTGGAFTSLDTIFEAAQTRIFPALLFAMIVFYGFKLVIQSHDESAQTEVKQAFGQAIFATALVGGAILLADAFAQPGTIANTAQANTVLDFVIKSLVALTFTVVVVNVFIQSYRLIAAQEDSDTDAAKKRLVHGAIGGAVAILAVTIVNAFMSPAGGSSLLSDQAVGIGNFLATIFGGVAVLGLLVSGIFLVLSVEEGLKDRARKLFFVSLAALVVVIVAYTIIRFFANI